MFKGIFLFFLLFFVVIEAANAQQSHAEKSLAAFFATKPSAHGAVAELVAMPQLPKITGHIRWSLPRLHFLPHHISLIAETGQGKQLRRWYINTHVRWMANVVSLKQDISARTMLDKSMLTISHINIAGLRGQTWSSIADVVGLKSLRNLRKNDVVLSTQFKRPPLIKRGDVISILAEVSGIKVRAAGIALKSGNLGDHMLVKNIRSKQTLQSTVEGAHTVSVFAGGV
jgi:flagella basal body P-ring formation protein FlgA